MLSKQNLATSPTKKTEEVGEKDLPEAILFSCSTNAKNVITSVWRPQH